MADEESKSVGGKMTTEPVEKKKDYFFQLQWLMQYLWLHCDENGMLCVL